MSQTLLPALFTAGDSLDVEISEQLYSAADGWAIKFELRGPSSITITSTGSGSTHTVAVAAATTAGWTAGDYWYQKYAVNSGTGKRATLGTGSISIKPNLATLAGAYDGRSQAKKILDAIDARLLNRATEDQNKYSIAGRSIDRIPVAELLGLRDKFSIMYQREVNAEKLRNGERPNYNIYVRLGGGK